MKHLCMLFGVAIFMTFLVNFSISAQSTRTATELIQLKDEKQADYISRIFPIGTRVLAMYPGKLFTSIGVVKVFSSKYRYLGTVSQLGPIKKSAISTIYVLYDDGDQSWVNVANVSAYVPFSSVGNPKDYVGKSIIARYYDSGNDASSWDTSYSRDSKFWYYGKINKVENNRIYIVYNDGDTKWHSDFKTISVLPDRTAFFLGVFPFYKELK